MRRFFAGLFCLFFVGCAAGTTIVIPPSGPSGGIEAPPLELRIGLFNESSRWIKIEGLVGMLGTDTLVLGPQRSIALAVRRYGEYGGIVTAYREGQPKKEGGVNLVGFLEQREFTLQINGGTVESHGRHFWDYEVFSDGDFRYDPHRPFPSIGIGQIVRFRIEN